MGMFKKVFRWNPRPGKEAILRAAQQAARETAQFVASRAVDYAPVDTGHMAYHIQVRQIGQGDTIGFRVISTAYYSAYVEFGHLTPSGTWVPPNPFMRRALADGAEEFPQIARRNRIGRGGVDNPEGYLGTVFTT